MNGRRIGPYQLLDVLGEGGIGQVYMARDTVLGRHVAIKMLRPELSRDRNFITRFHNEAQNLGDLGHANITTLYALHLEGQEPFMVMELVHGHTLEALLARVRRFPMSESLAVVAQITAGLAFAHRRGVVHRDIKPANLMVTDTGVLKIMDFGIARVRGTRRLTRAGQMFGTLLYASPEQIKGNDVDERSDLYSLAIVLYELLVGRPPFTAENEHALMTSHLQTPPPPLTGLVQGLDAKVEPALMRALAKNPEERFASVEEFGRAIGAAAVRGDAADILQDFVSPIFRDTPARTRLVNVPSDDALEPDKGGRQTNVGVGRSPPRPRGFRFPWPRTLPNSLRAPATVLGGAVLALGLSLGYFVFWPSRSAPPPQLAATEPTRITSQPPHQPSTEPGPPTSPAPVEASKTIPPPAHAPSSAAPVSATTTAAETPPPKPPTQPATPRTPPAESADASQMPSPAPNSATTERSLAPTPVVFPPSTPSSSNPSLLEELKLASRTTPAPEPGPPVGTFAPTSQSKADIRGSVSAVESASRIRVGGQWLDLYGINDPTQREHTKDVLGYLQPSRGVVECYQKIGGRYQCYADGKDLALLALRDGLARAAADAPQEYRSVPPQQKSARH
jgi:eukaryotic-like serine/threonine-protein kinase